MKPILYAFLAAAIWGLWWIPVRYLEEEGLPGALGGMAMNGGAFVASVLWLVILRQRFGLGRVTALGAALAGVAVATYSVALNFGDVVRVVLLFYLAPAWSKIIEWWFLDMPWRWNSTVALVAALSGAFLVLGGDVAAGALGLGDGLAILSGLAWAIGAALIFTTGNANVASLTVVTSLSAVLVGVPFLGLNTGATWGPGIAPAVGTGMGFGVIYVLPILALTLWSAQRLPPATLSFLLTAEILSGIVSGVLLLDEPFGIWQALGAVLIIFGALSDVLPVMVRRAGSKV